MFDQETLNVDSFENELQRYQTSPDPFDPHHDDLLEWWNMRTDKYPRLSKAARKLLTIPSSSTSPERSFSRSRFLITDQRTLLSADTVSGLMLGASY
uniref:HAT C-terminal dimerisation domain-containing protein n=1 Tax=Panagrolaimus superbus TaxID=310955 RepID=A0A914YCH4_9BILA